MDLDHPNREAYVRAFQGDNTRVNLATAVANLGLSGFWARSFFAVKDYSEGDERRSYAELQAGFNRAARHGVSDDALSPLGRFYAGLAGRGKGAP